MQTIETSLSKSKTLAQPLLINNLFLLVSQLRLSGKVGPLGKDSFLQKSRPHC